MLPSNLLRAKISRGTISPLYASLDFDTMALAERISGIFRDATGKRRGELMDKLREVENGGNDFKLVRGLSTLLERRCTFEPEGKAVHLRAHDDADGGLGYVDPFVKDL